MASRSARVTSPETRAIQLQKSRQGGDRSHLMNDQRSRRSGPLRPEAVLLREPIVRRMNGATIRAGGCMTRLGLLLLLIAASAFPLIARQAAPTFEVASVKRAPPPQPVNRVVQQVSPPGTFNRTTTVAVLIQLGYDLQ